MESESVLTDSTSCSAIVNGETEGKGRSALVVALSVHQQLKRPLDVHAMANTRHSQINEVIFLQVWQVRSLDLVLHEGVSVFGHVEALQPVSDVMLGPQQDRLAGKRLGVG